MDYVKPIHTVEMTPGLYGMFVARMIFRGGENWKSVFVPANYSMATIQ
jgi:hypothetical protein